MRLRMIRLAAAASIFACVLAAGMAPAAAASTEDAPGTVLPAAEDPSPVQPGEGPAADPTPLPEPSPYDPPPYDPPPAEPPPAEEEAGADETTEPAPTDSPPTDSPPTDTPPGEATTTEGDGQPGPPSEFVGDAPPDDATPPADAPPGEAPAAEPPRVAVEGIAPEPPAVAPTEPDVAATGPAVNARSAPKPATHPRSTGSAPSGSTAPSQAADRPAAASDPASSMDALARTRRPDPSPDAPFDRAAAAGAGFMAGLAVTGRAHATIAVAVEFGRAGGGWAGALVFNLWLRRQLRERRMSQRQLAAISGVDHSTISRLLSEDRRPSLATATKLVAALGHVRGEEAEPAAADYFQRMPEETVFPARRVELALRADEALDEQQVRQLMSMYLNARRRHQAMQERPAPMGRLGPAGPPEPASVRRR
ncbi:MAG TPA: helix-turn-helix domain-containing protein [Candidatus Limnocylindrales bacterium]|nr:helix-turn-helix domain-containing protein [Candidatus Limnocylindrales bacterium]